VRSVPSCLSGMTLFTVSNKTWLNVEGTLELLESGQMQHRERRDGGAWVDTTQREIDWHKKTIGMYGGLIRKLRAEHGE
jgi:hypothetical protein